VRKLPRSLTVAATMARGAESDPGTRARRTPLPVPLSGTGPPQTTCPPGLPGRPPPPRSPRAAHC
jgi:hypothetical protein